ncbi:hypothetical protein COLO4_08030 [Corchorus olitorius]|uniref:Uncharacterized protein n=1 Tax=Corchorus olitorius TaxID=93759 RepID=A0A1R3KHL5_9ROSI|nr:hypothetical protein COLO4_08030 [Corchorus olitorius]
MTRLLNNEYNGPSRLNYLRFAVKTLTTHAKQRVRPTALGLWAQALAAF